MRISEQWLKELVDTDIAVDELASELTMAGLEVDSVEMAAPQFSGVVVAEIVECEKHPDADKLNVCKVNKGDEEVQIVCGAPNARKGLKAPLATIGGVLPGDFKIKKAKLRGVQSFGMLCSDKELGVSESSAGLMELPADAPVGTDIREYLQLNDNIIEVDLTPNRGDCLGMTGVAREVGVITKSSLKDNTVKPVAAVCSDELDVKIEATADCPRYIGRIVRNINVNAETPLWMKEKLRRGGIRSISPTVDITNYILLEMGQPMHAFDLAKIDGGIIVRKAADGEELELLDGQTVKLNAETLVIADHQKALAMAGVMGGEQSSVTDATKDVFLESAFFAPHLIAGKARSYGLHTDSSHRFERGVDPQKQIEAIEKATALLLEITGGEPGVVVEAKSEADLPQKGEISLREKMVSKVLGVSIERAVIEDILVRLGMEIKTTDDGWTVLPPQFRFDIEIEADLIEEIGRVYGYNNIPDSAASVPQVLQIIPEAEVTLEQVETLFIERGYQEAVTYSFVCPETQKLINDDSAVELTNPISADMSVMRTTIWTGLVKAAQHNINRQNSRVRLFESGSIFRKDGDKTVQEKTVAGIVTGSRKPDQWSCKSQAVDFYDVKADLEALFSLGRNEDQFEFTTAKNKALHPGQTAEIIRGGESIGWIGAIHPALAKKLDLPTSTYLFEIILDGITQGELNKYHSISKFPSIRRDIAIVINDNVEAGAVVKSILEISSEILHDVAVFDVYKGEGIEKDRKSLAISLILRHFSRTLIDNEVDDVVEQVVEKLSQQFGAKLRN